MNFVDQIQTTTDIENTNTSLRSSFTRSAVGHHGCAPPDAVGPTLIAATASGVFTRSGSSRTRAKETHGEACGRDLNNRLRKHKDLTPLFIHY